MPLPVNPLPVIRQIFEMLLIWRLQNLSIVMTYGWHLHAVMRLFPCYALVKCPSSRLMLDSCCSGSGSAAVS